MTTLGPTSAVGHGLGAGAGSVGYPWDPSEFSPELAWPTNIGVYDRMRRQDAQTKSVLNALGLPIRRATYHLDPHGAPHEAVRLIADDLGLPVLGEDDPETRLRSRQRFDWRDHLRLALLSLSYGHMPFEIVGQIEADGLWHLIRLEERLPPTLLKINVARNGRLESVEQTPSGIAGDVGLSLTIPAGSLVFYAHEREGGMWQGQSILRSAYKHWLLKDRLIRADQMKHERNGLGIPVIEAPEHASDKQVEHLNEVASKWRAGEASGAALPFGAKLRLVGVEGSLPDTLASVRYHDEQIAQEALAMFMKLGSSATGSRALGSEFIDFFTLVLQAVAEEHLDTFNEQMLEPWVDWNWGPDTPAPRIVTTDVGDNHEITAEALAGLVRDGALTADAKLDQWIRDRYRMPDADTTPTPPPPAPVPPPPPAAVEPEPAAADRRRRPFSHAASPGNTDTAPDGWPGGPYLAALTGYYTPRISKILTGALDPDAVAAGFLSTRQTVTAAADDETRRRAGEYAGGLSIDDDALIDELRRLWGDAYLAGTHSADEILARAGLTIRDRPWDAMLDWSKWKPGYSAAAAEIAGRDGGRGLVMLLQAAGVEIIGINGTTLQAIAERLATALDEGWGVEKAGREIRGYLGDPVRARMIAQTETARAMSIATLDSYAEHGIAEMEWLRSSGACPLCVENADAGPVPIGSGFPNALMPPQHPYCVCALSPVVAGAR